MALKPVPPEAERVAKAILDAAYEVHSEVGPGCLERVYAVCLEKVLRDQGHRVLRELYLPIRFRGLRLEEGYRLDLLVDDLVIVEAKAVEALTQRHVAQTITYLRLADKPLAWLFNFAEPHLRDGDPRVVHPDYVTLPASWQKSA